MSFSEESTQLLALSSDMKKLEALEKILTSVRDKQWERLDVPWFQSVWRSLSTDYSRLNALKLVLETGPVNVSQLQAVLSCVSSSFQSKGAAFTWIEAQKTPPSLSDTVTLIANIQCSDYDRFEILKRLSWTGLDLATLKHLLGKFDSSWIRSQVAEHLIAVVAKSDGKALSEPCQLSALLDMFDSDGTKRRCVDACRGVFCDKEFWTRWKEHERAELKLALANREHVVLHFAEDVTVDLAKMALGSSVSVRRDGVQVLLTKMAGGFTLWGDVRLSTSRYSGFTRVVLQGKSSSSETTGSDFYWTRGNLITLGSTETSPAMDAVPPQNCNEL